MEIVSNYGVYNPKYSSVTEVKRSQPAAAPVPETNKTVEDRPKYNWKTVAIVAGVSALALLGIKNRKTISGVAKNIFKNGAEDKKPFHNPNMRVEVNNTKSHADYVPISQIQESFEPERLSDLMLKKQRINQQKLKNRIYIDQNGEVIRQEQPIFYRDDKHGSSKKSGFNFQSRDFSSQRMDTRTTKSSRYTPGDAFDDATDAAINFAFVDDIVNGGKEIKQGFDYVKNIFKGGRGAGTVENGMAGVDDVVGTSPVGDVVSDFGEHTSSFVESIFDRASDIVDSIGDGLGDIADSIGDII